jgi:LacI family transcriptional regulator
MRDVAALAGVGIKTVSRVVNGEQGVSDALVRRVQDATQKLSFQPDLVAGNLRRADRRSLSIGLLLASVDNPFCATIHRAVEAVADGQGVAVFSASIDEDIERERALVGAFLSRRVDGLIVTPTAADQIHLQPDRVAGTPVVLVDRPAVGIQVDAVVVDNVGAAQQATAHLIEHGHRRVAYLGDLTQIVTARQRHEGYLLAMAAAGIPAARTHVIADLHSEAAAESAILGLLTGSDRPTALFTSQNMITIGALRALRALRLQHKIAVVAFDDVELADLLDPGVTVIAQNPTSIGRQAAELMFARLDGDESPAMEIVVPTRLLTRGSGEIRPPESPNP